METPNYIALMSDSIDALGKSFTAQTYGAFASQIAPVLSGLLILYMIFWGFRFWQGKGEKSVIQIAFRLFRIAIIFSIATGWGSTQMVIYRVITDIPSSVSSVMMNNIVNVGHGSMSRGTVERDLYDFYRIAVMASTRISGQSAGAAKRAVAAAPVQPADPAAPAASRAPAPASPADNGGQTPDIMGASLYSAIVWIAAALFIGYAVFLMLFCKMALWVVLALAPVFILLLLFQGVSRFFSGWLTTAVQTMLVPIFFYVFLSFYLIVIKDIVIALSLSMDKGLAPGMKDIAPFVLICFSGLFLLVQIVPLSSRLASGANKLLDDAIQTGAGHVSNAVAGLRGKSGAHSTGSAAPLLRPGGMPSPSNGSQQSASEVSDTLIRDMQDRNLAANRQTRNR
jgi:type IV secretion system protein VirB6